MKEEFYTVPEIIQLTGISETTLRRYISIFSDFLEYRQYGRMKKYNLQAIELLKKINVAYTEGKSKQEIFQELDKKNPNRIIEIKENKSLSLTSQTEAFRQIVVTQQQIAVALEQLAEKDREINDLRQEIKELRENQQVAERRVKVIDEREKDIINHIKEMEKRHLQHAEKRDIEIMERMRQMIDQQPKRKKGIWDWFKR